MSQTYRQSSKLTKALKAKDPSNQLLARGARFRLPSMILRDVALAAGELLNTRMYDKPEYPYQPKGIWDGLNITLERNFEYPKPENSEHHRRSIYTFWRRTVAPGNMFDASPRNACTVSQSRTSTPMHALTMLNDVTWFEGARGVAQLATLWWNTPEERLTDAFRRICGRVPSGSELKVLQTSLERAETYFASNPKAVEEYLSQGELPIPHKNVELAAYTTVCHAILNLDEAMTRE